MALAKDEARRLGAPRVGLHALGHHAGAQALYVKLGYVPRNVLMAKDLGP